MTAADGPVALENTSLLQPNAFEVAVEEDQLVERLRLVAQPVSKDTKFDIQSTSRVQPSELDTRMCS
jgi:hypothetical protein